MEIEGKRENVDAARWESEYSESQKKMKSQCVEERGREEDK